MAGDFLSVVTYQFEIEDATWTAWKNTVPRSKTLDTRLVELIEADTDDSGEREYVAEDDEKACNYGPSAKLDDGWVLDVTTDDGGHVDVHFPEGAMYGLWVEVQGQPWPDRLDDQAEEADLRRELVERANGADAETLHEALEAIKGAADE